MTDLHKSSMPAARVIEGYCADFIAFAAPLAQMLEQVTIRGVPIEPCRPSLERIERGMRELAAAISELLQRNVVAPPPAPARTAPPSPPPRPASAPAAPPAPAASPRPAALPAQTAAPGQPPVLCGSNKDLPLRSVFQFLGRMRKTGLLLVHVGGETITFGFKDGHVDSSSSDRAPADEQLGAMLIELGFASREELEPVLQRAGQLNKRALGTRLVNEGLVSNGQIAEALERQVGKRFRRAIAALEVTFEFQDGERRGGDGRIRIAPFELLHASPQPLHP